MAQTPCLASVHETLAPQQTQHICIAFVQRRTNVFDVGPTLYKCYTNGFAFTGPAFSRHWEDVCSCRCQTCLCPSQHPGNYDVNLVMICYWIHPYIVRLFTCYIPLRLSQENSNKLQVIMIFSVLFSFKSKICNVLFLNNADVFFSNSYCHFVHF